MTNFGRLKANDQWALHDYYRLADELSEAELLAHRKAITKAHPSLPHRAGRAISNAYHRRYFTPQPAEDGVVVTGALVQPTIEAGKLMDLLIEIASRDEPKPESDPHTGDVEDSAA